jgi:Response regulator containing CheY-like receiver domain and AraC-type DNA-binding domain
VTSSRLAAVPTPSTGTETVLVVEDEEAVRDIAKRIPREAGNTVLTAASPEDALLTCKTQQNKIDLLLTDVVMPQMSGRMLADRLALERPGIKVLYMSGYTDDAIVHHGTLDPGTHFIAKPFGAADLTKKVREMLDSGDTKPADGHEQADAAMKQQPLEKDALRALPLDVLNRLRQAVLAARYDEIIELLETVRIADANLAAELRRMADVFDYDGMRALLNPRSWLPRDGFEGVLGLDLDHQLDPPVGFAALGRAVVGNGHRRAAAGGDEHLALDVVGALYVAGHGCGTGRGQIPVVAEARAPAGLVVGVAFDADGPMELRQLDGNGVQHRDHFGAERGLRRIEEVRC